MQERGGVLLGYADGAGGSARAFIPAEVATRLVALTSLTEVLGARPPLVGIALADGAIVTVLDIGGGVPAPRLPRASTPPPGSRPAPLDDWPVPGANRAVLCTVGALEIAILGGTVLTTGLFQAAEDGGVFWRGEVVPVLDVRALYAQAETAIWAERATGRPASVAPRSASPSTAPSAPAPRLTRGDGS